jgi:hypothetical protein
MRPAFGNFTQVAYVTTDIGRALETFRRVYNVPGFMVADQDFPAWVAGKDGQMKICMALANFDGVQVELIEPRGGLSGLYGDILPADGSFAIKFHHTCVEVLGTVQDWQRHIAELPADRPVCFRGNAGTAAYFAYTDERPHIGHYMEHVWFSPELKRRLAGAIPYHPTVPTVPDVPAD